MEDRRIAQRKSLMGFVSTVGTASHTRKDRKFTREDVAEHCTANDMWVIAHGMVYDVTKAFNDHPGGQQVLLRKAGTDVSRDYDHHRDHARWKRYRIGTLENEGDGPMCAVM